MAMPSPARRGLNRRVPSGRPAVSKLRSRPSKPVATRRVQKAAAVTTPGALVHELGSCITEADIIQVLYRGLEPLFGYDVVLLQVLEREGWYHSVAIDSGVLQDLRRRPLSGSIWAEHYTVPSPTVVKSTDTKHLEIGKGPGG